MKPGRIRLLIPGLLVALLVVVAVAAGIRRGSADPSAVPFVPTTRVSVIDDPRITESSGLAASQTHPGLAYTVNDSGHAPQVFAIDIASGRVVGVTTIEGVRWTDTEAMGLWDGKLWVADTGNNSLKRGDDRALYAFDEPGIGDRRMTAARYPVTFRPSRIDVEAVAFVPGRIDFYSKGWPEARAFVLPWPLSTTTENVARMTNRVGPPLTTDATATADGRLVLVRGAAQVEVRDARTWTLLRRDAVPIVGQGETVTVEASGRSYLIGSEGSDSPLLRVALDRAHLGGPVTQIDPTAQLRADHPIDWLIWRYWRYRKALLLVAALAVGAIVALVVSVRRRRQR